MVYMDPMGFEMLFFHRDFFLWVIAYSLLGACRFAGHSLVLIAVTFFTGLPHHYIAVQQRAVLFQGDAYRQNNDLMIRLIPIFQDVFEDFNHPKNHGISKLMVWRSLKPPNFGESTPSFLEGLSCFLGQRWTYRNLEWYCKAKRGGRSRPNSQK